MNKIIETVSKDLAQTVMVVAVATTVYVVLSLVKETYKVIKKNEA